MSSQLLLYITLSFYITSPLSTSIYTMKRAFFIKPHSFLFKEMLNCVPLYSTIKPPVHLVTSTTLYSWTYDTGIIS